MPVVALARWSVTLAAAMVLGSLTGCTSDPGSASTDPPRTSSGESSSSRPDADPRDQYVLREPRPWVAGEDGEANAALLEFAQALADGDESAATSDLIPGSPDPDAVVASASKAYRGTSWDETTLRWAESGPVGPCFLIEGAGQSGEVYLTGIARWDQGGKRWRFSSDWLPGAPRHPDVPTCT